MRMSPHSCLIGGSFLVGVERGGMLSGVGRKRWLCFAFSEVVCVETNSFGVTVGDDFLMGREFALWMLFWDVPRRNVSYFGFELSLH